MTLTKKLATSVTMFALLAIFAVPAVSFADHGEPHYSVQFVAFEDVNDNGVQESEEPGIEGVTMNLNNSDVGVDVTLITDAKGVILFENFPSGMAVLSMVDFPSNLVIATNTFPFPVDVEVDHDVTWPAAGFLQGISPPNDTTPPVITVTPNDDGNVDFDLLIGETYVEFGATAIDDVDGSIDSGDIAITGLVDTTSSGMYVVTYTASDAAENEASKSRTVTVFTQQEALDKIEQEINDAITNGDIGNNANGLLSKLDQIMNKLDSNNTNAACNQLNAFINQVEDLIASGDLDSEVGQPILDAATGIHSNYC